MKKNILLFMTIMLAAAGTAWGQGNSVQEFQPTYTNNSPAGNAVYTYDGTEMTGVTVNGSNCTMTPTITGDKATNAGSYTAHITISCLGHTIVTAGTYPSTFTFHHAGDVAVTWQILPRDLTDGVTITVNDTQWTGGDIAISSVINEISFNGNNLTAGTDYIVYVTKESTPGNVRDEGRYSLVFQGIGNFKGTVTKTFDVKKDMTQEESVTGVHYDIPEQILKNGATGIEFQADVTDTKSHTALFKGEDYEVKFYSDEACNTEVAEDAITVTGAGKKYWAKFTGLKPKYDENTSIVKAFYVVNEYQTYDHATYADINMRITKAGYPVATDSPTGSVIRGEMQVAPMTDGKPAIDLDSLHCEIPAEMTVTVTEDLNYNIVGIANNAFSGCTTLRWINSLIPGNTYTPSSLDRTVIDTPFYGVPRQTLIYLFGYTITGENYIYKITPTEFRSERFHIYEDVVGNQTKYSDAE